MKIYKTILTALFLLFGLSGVVNADSEVAPYPWVTTSKNEKVLFKMVPQKWHWEENDKKMVVDQEAFGVAYSIDENGDFQELWRVEGWYAFSGEISDDGKYFVRYGPWARDQKEFTDLAIAFYDNGELLKEYQVQELIKNTNCLEHSISHYQWKAAVQSDPNGFYGNEFHLVMVDKTAYRFDRSIGDILDVGEDVGAKSRREIQEEEHAKKEKKGLEILAHCDFKESFDEHFTFYFVGAIEGEMSGVHYKPPTWQSHLRPKKEYPHDCDVSLSLTIKNDQKISTSITPTEIDVAFEAALNHPYVQARFKKDKSLHSSGGLTLYMREDYLHSNSVHIQNQFKQIKGYDLDDQDLRDWVEFWITPNYPECTSFFLNTKTKELIYRDRKNYDEPFVLSIAGQDWK